MYVFAYPLLAIVGIVSSILTIYTYILIAAVIMTWINPDPYNPIVRIIRQITDPALSLVRPYVPVIGGIDLTPIAVILLVTFLKAGILPIIAQFAQGLM